MDSEVWASLLSATKRRLALHSYGSDGTLNHNDQEAHDDMQVEFACPFCSDEFDIGSLCSHIEEEHCFEPKAAVCPVCSTKVKNDMVGHITIQHGNLFKMQRRRFRMAVASVGSTLSSIVKERGVAALQVRPNGNNNWSAVDAFPLGTDPLANIFFGLPPSEGGELCKLTEASSMDKKCVAHQPKSSNLFTSLEKSEKQLEAAALRASFIENLVISTVFRDN